MNNFNNKYRSTEDIRDSINNTIENINPAQPVSSSWDEAIRKQKEDMSRQNGIRHMAQMEQIQRKSELDGLRQRSDFQDITASAMAMAGRNGGSLSPELIRYANDAYGFGDVAGLQSAGFNKETGEFEIVVGRKNSNGGVDQKRMSIPRTAQLGIMANYPGIFSPEEVKSFKDSLKGKYSDEEIIGFENFAKFAQQRLNDRISRINGDIASYDDGRGRLTFGQRTQLEEQKQKGRKDIADANNANKLSIAELGAELKKMGYAVDEKKLSEAVRHNKVQEDLLERSIDEKTAHDIATEELGQAKLEHNKNRLENDKAQKEADRQLRIELANIGALARRNAGRSGSGQSDPVLKEIQQLQKTIDGGRLTPENRESMRKRINELAEKYGVQSDKGTIKPSDNSGDGEFKELSREEFAELAKTDRAKAESYLAELKKRKSSK